MKNNQNPFVSVIMPCYNVELYLERSLNSILNQTYQNFEIICIDDYSKDKTFEILCEYAKTDERIKVFKNKKNLGVTSTRNKLVENTKYDLILNMDSDDISEPQRIEKLVKEQVLFNADIVSSSYTFIDGKDKKLKTRGLDVLKTKKGVKYVTFFNSPIPHAPCLIKKSLLTNFKYNEKYLATEDYKLFSSIFEEGNDFIVRIILEPLYLYRINLNGVSVSNNSIQSQNHIRIAKEFLTKEFDLQGKDFSYWKLSKDKESLLNMSRIAIISSLKQINEVKNLYKKKYNLTHEELEEINSYTYQYYFFTYYSLIKQSFNNKKILKAISCISLSFILNFKFLLNKKNIKWIIKQI